MLKVNMNPAAKSKSLMRGGSAERRRGKRSISKVNENPAARSKILREGQFLQYDKKTEKSEKM